MARYTIKVPNDDEGEDLGTFEADFLPRVGDQFVLLHPRVNPRKDEPFVGKVDAVTHEAYATRGGDRHVTTTVWVVDEAAAPQLYCDCSEEERSRHGVDEDSNCESCGHRRRT